VSTRRVEQSDPHLVWVFSEAEFKEALGITDPQGVLTVHVDFDRHAVKVFLART
jgi:hypothetical protein